MKKKVTKKYTQSEDEVINSSPDLKKKSRMRKKFTHSKIAERSLICPTLLGNVENRSPPLSKEPEDIPEESFDATYFSQYEAKKSLSDGKMYDILNIEV